MSQELLFDQQDGVATITLNRPELLNAFTPSMIDAWAEALRECARDERCKAVIVTGTGRAFCSGGDTKAMGKGAQEQASDQKAWLWEHVQQVPLAAAALDKPLLSAINGLAVGAGLDLALLGDLRFCAEGARFAETYVKMGLVPGSGGAWLLPRIVGLSKALEILWLGEWIESGEAERIGLVNKVYPADQLMPQVMEVALRMASGPTVATRMMKRLAVSSAATDFKTHLDMVSSHLAVTASTADHREAVTARAEKRSPVFTGR
ncbi:enoyl-CoA hydratase/isomerase family protein [Hydrogenophaga sp. BPS33]|uniref:enoyl-CoA hydratase/isomerase family protein n=1 Tax=Hydrogenophaga sp. BPS33 TaxID=2651974 RepID=UPI0013203375|nr:enoyl-CoA hydratase-related protein [Hydrogenophaga sp. BPS33]QHE84785.1 enoyl-CoA hydratase [Hydrogenophaga sp. BPS33]